MHIVSKCGTKTYRCYIIDYNVAPVRMINLATHKLTGHTLQN